MTHIDNKCDFGGFTGVYCQHEGQQYSWRMDGERRFARLCEAHATTMEGLFPITFRKES